MNIGQANAAREFGRILQAARERTGLPLKKVANNLGMHPAELWEVERGKAPPLDAKRIRIAVHMLGIEGEQFRAWAEEYAALSERGAV